jgi:hypothetical protein
MAKEWSYDYSDPNELVEVRNGRRYPYSLDVNRYRPLCKACHNASDLRIPYAERYRSAPMAPAVEFEAVHLAPIITRRTPGVVVDLRKPPGRTGIRRRCSVCRMIKDEGSFGWRSRERKYRASRCRYCDAGLSKENYRKIKERTRADRARNATASRRTYERNRDRSIEVYGGKCAWCNATADLEFDHLDNDGRLHREIESVAAMYARISRTGRPLDDWRLQLLCKPCHRDPGWRQRRANATPASSALDELRRATGRPA